MLLVAYLMITAAMAAAVPLASRHFGVPARDGYWIALTWPWQIVRYYGRRVVQWLRGERVEW